MELLHVMCTLMETYRFSGDRYRTALRDSRRDTCARGGGEPNIFFHRPRLLVRSDLYGILQVPKSATTAEVNKAFRTLVKKLHPDVNPSSQATRLLQAVNDAHAVLSNEVLRGIYDRRGYSALGLKYAKYAATGGFVGSKSKRAEPGKDLLKLVWLDVVEAALGAERVLRVKVVRSCPSCSGIASQTMVNRSCSLCRGTGQVPRRCPSEKGGWRYSGSCPRCGGVGISSQQWCQDCGGGGLAHIVQNLRVKIPPGVDHNSVLRLKERGDAGKNGGRYGDIYVSFVIKPRPDIQRRGRDLVSKVNVAYLDAILGAEYKVDTLSGTAWLTIPPGTQHGTSLELPHAGSPIITQTSEDMGMDSQQKGCHIFEISVRVPVALNTEELLIFQQLRYACQPQSS